MRRAFMCTSWVPPALWGATLIYLRPYDGWGAWAAAPLLLPSLFLSAVWAALGVILLGRAWMNGRRLDLPLLAATVLSGAVVLYYTLRHLLRSAA